MNTILTIKDLELIKEFYQKNNPSNKAHLINFVRNIDKNMIVAASIINGKINSMISINLIKNNYYLDYFKYLVFNLEELKSLLSFLLKYLSANQAGINIYFDNYPFNEIYDSILIKSGFKYSFLNYTNDPSKDKIEVFNSHFFINDKSFDVKEYFWQNNQRMHELYNKYLGLKSENIPEINLDNTNVVVIRNNQNQVIGVSRFGLVSNEMFINSLYAEDEETYLEILKIIKSLTSKRIQIGILPVRVDLIDILNRHGYLISHADYIKGVSE